MLRVCINTHVYIIFQLHQLSAGGSVTESPRLLVSGPQRRQLLPERGQLLPRVLQTRFRGIILALVVRKNGEKIDGTPMVSRFPRGT